MKILLHLTAFLGSLCIPFGAVYSQDLARPKWIIANSSQTNITNTNKFALRRASLEDFELNSLLLRPINNYIWCGINADIILQNRFQVARIGGLLRYYPWTSSKKINPFVGISPGLGWNRNVYLVPIPTGCSSCSQFETFNSLFFFPAGEIGISIRHPNHDFSLDISSVFRSGYDAGPFQGIIPISSNLNFSIVFWVFQKNEK